MTEHIGRTLPTALRAHNKAKGDETRSAVYAVMQKLGPTVSGQTVADIVGVSRVTAGKAMRAIKEGWKP